MRRVSSTREPVLGFQPFCELLGRRLGLPCGDWSADARLEEDVAFDSLQVLEAVVLMEELGAAVSEEEMSQIVTLGDLHQHYAVEAAVRA